MEVRYIENVVAKDLETKMVFLGGPRQVGKTTFSKNLAQNFGTAYQYFNWDDLDDQKKILNQEFFPEKTLLLFDEIHKYSKWKNFIKGIYDTKKEKYSILVTGSARLDLYKKGGDSLLGRYHYYRLHPFSVAEILHKTPDMEILEKSLYEKIPTIPLSFEKETEEMQKTMEDLFVFGGFPESFFAKSIKTLRRWQKERISRLVKEDIRDASSVHDISKVQIFAGLVPERVGSKFSLESIRQDVGGMHQTVAKYAQYLEDFYYFYRISPFTGSLAKSTKKEPKIFLWDYSEVPSDGAKFENLVGSHLLKFVHFLEDVFGVNASLHYWADKDGREVDFVVVVDKTPIWAIEVKLSDTKPSNHLKYLKEKIPFQQCFQIVKTPETDFEKDGIRIMSAGKFLAALV